MLFKKKHQMGKEREQEAVKEHSAEDTIYIYK